MEAKYNFLQVKDGKTHFARVTVVSNPQADGVKISALHENPPDFEKHWLDAARLGAERALAAFTNRGGQRVGLEIKSVQGTEVDTRADAVELAGFCAAWKALGNDEAVLKIEFDDRWRVSEPRELL